ncbi:MAG: hypothetical protein ACK5LC_11070 [Coprobacillaceae bacterium]
MNMLKKIYNECKEKGFLKWIKTNPLVSILLFIMLLSIASSIIITINFIGVIIRTDRNILLYSSLAIIYSYGCVYFLVETINTKERKLKKSIKNNNKNIIISLEHVEYVSLFFCIATTIRNLSTMIIIFMFNAALDMLSIDKTSQHELDMFIYGSITMIVCSSSLTIMSYKFIINDSMILVNNDFFIKKKARKLYEKYNK